MIQPHGIQARGKRKLKATTDSNHGLPVAPNQVWAIDISHIATDAGWLLLAVVIDPFSRQAVGWSMQRHMKKDLVLDALRMAQFGRQPEPGWIFHSDRGNQSVFCSHEFQALLKAYGMRSSMRRKGNGWDNAPTASP